MAANADGRSPPHPYRLLEQFPSAFDFVEYSAPIDLSEARRDAPLFAEMESRRGEVPLLFHPVHLNLWGPALESEAGLELLKDHLLAVNSPWVSNDVAWWHREDQPFPGYQYLSPPFTEEAVQQCAAHALALAKHSPVPVILENPAVIARRGPLHLSDFFQALADETGLDLLLDLGHLLSFQLSAGLRPDHALDRYPWDRVIELHVAGGAIRKVGSRAFYADDHTQPIPEVLFSLLEKVLPKCTRLRALTYEADGHPPALARLTLERLRQFVPKQSRPPIPASNHKESKPVLLESAWSTYDQAFGRAASEDPEGAREELSFRLAVLAQEIERSWPLSRLFFPNLAEFAASDELKQGKSFAAWARRKALLERDEEAAAVLAFEAWANTMAGRGTVTFPVDLTELLIGAEAAKRHAVGRAWFSPLEVDLASLRDLVRRAPRRSWSVRLTREHGALTVSF